MFRKNTDKAALRAMLSQAYEEKTTQDPDAVTLYASVLPVTHKPWSPKPVEKEDLYQQEVDRLLAEKAAQEALKNAPPEVAAEAASSADLTLEDFPGLLEASSRYRRR